ncbi:MAG TPA: magnesium transporter CorA family protein [Acidimicrobiia bacterium]|nr:magnesium transporter CorA family protein [Acidimicrobiia bacterium]
MIRAWRYATDADHRTDVEPSDLGDAVDREHAVLWVDGESVSEEERDLLHAQLRIPASVVEAFTNPYERTKLLRYGECFHVAVHDCEMRGNDVESREIDVVIGPGWLLTVRHPVEGGRPVDLDVVAHRFDVQRAEHGTVDEGLLLWALFDTVIDRYFDVTDSIDDCLDHVEEIVFGDDTPTGIPREAFSLRRALQEFRRAAAPMREVLNAIDRREVPYVEDAAVVHFRDLYDRMLRVVDLIESQRDLLTGLLEAELAIISNRTNDVMKRMTSWGAILLGSTLIAGIYGMNFRHMPELGWELGYPFALGSMLLLTIVLYTWFKKKDWL